MSSDTELVQSAPRGAALEQASSGTAARETAMIQAALVMARQYPRVEQDAYQAVLTSTKRRGFAEDSFYSFPRGTSQVQGPSVYLAREAARAWGNLQYGNRVLSFDQVTDLVTMQGYAYDLQSNMLKTTETTFRLLVQRKDKRTGETHWVTPDERDARELMGKQGAILERNALLQILPSDFIEDWIRSAKETLSKTASEALKSDPATFIKQIVGRFYKHGVSAAQLIAFLGKDLEMMTKEEAVALQGLVKSFDDGHQRPNEVFKATEEKAEGNSAASGLKKATEKLKGRATPPPETSTEREPEPDRTPAAEIMPEQPTQVHESQRRNRVVVEEPAPTVEVGASDFKWS